MPPPDEAVPRLLIAKGWKQGSVFRAEGAELYCAHADPADAAGFVMRSLSLPPGGCFVVASQTCDIDASLDKEPVVEALACAVEPDPLKRSSFRRSFRWFEIDRVTGLVAHAMYRVPFDKRGLLSVDPKPWPDTPERLELFARWLARRASRSAIPDPIVKSFVQPLRKVLDKLEERQPEVFQAFGDAVQEIRIGFPENEEQPFEINMVLLLDESGLLAEGAESIEKVCDALKTRLKPDQARLGEVLTLTRDRMSVALYFATALVDFEAMSYEGDALVGASPPPPA